MLRKIPENGCIGVIAPAYAPDMERTQLGIRYLQGRGFTIIQGETLSARHGHFAGTDELRLKDLERMFSDPQIDAIICARGGWGCLRYVDRIDYQLIARNPKALVGYSDITTLQLAIYKETGLPSFSGPMVAVEMGKGILGFTEKHFWNQIFNQDPHYPVDLSEAGANFAVNGRAEGRLLGGCLSLVACQLGSPYMPDFTDSILFIEDVGESPYKIDRYLAQLRQAGLLDTIKGVILGEFIDCDPEKDDQLSFPTKELLYDYFAHLSIPVVDNFPYGHGMKKIAMPMGIHVSMDSDTDTLVFDNPFLSAL